jgi:hypothetical protein
VSGCTGDIVEVPIHITMNPSVSISSLSYAITYDNSVLSGNNTNQSTRISGLATEFSTIITNFSTFNGIPQFRATWFDLTPVLFNGVIFNVKFKILTSGSHLLTWDIINIGNCEYTDEIGTTIEPVEWTNGSVLENPNCNSFIEIVPSVSVTQTPTITPTPPNNFSHNTIFLTFN